VGIPLTEVGELCYYDWLLCLRDAVITKLRTTESGREYLNECWILEQTKPDRKKLRENFGKEETANGA